MPRVDMGPISIKKYCWSQRKVSEQCKLVQQRRVVACTKRLCWTEVQLKDSSICVVPSGKRHPILAVYGGPHGPHLQARRSAVPSCKYRPGASNSVHKVLQSMAAAQGVTNECCLFCGVPACVVFCAVLCCVVLCLHLCERECV